MGVLKRIILILCTVSMLISSLLSSLFLLPALVFAGACWNGGYSGTAPWYVKNSSGSDSIAYTDVNYCVNTVAASRDTVNVPAGIVTWNSPLIVTKAIKLIGAGSSGASTTTITSNFTDAYNGLISYKPASPNPNQSVLFRLSGFILDGNNMTSVVYMENPASTTTISWVRIDHNIIQNAGGIGAGRSIYVRGNFYGVIDNNTIHDAFIGAEGNNMYSWGLPRTFGNENTIYFEDNVFDATDAIWDAGTGGRYAVRYNTFTENTVNIYPWFDMHGNTAYNLGTMMAEVYGNTISLGNYGGTIMSHRGGQALVFNNYASQTANQSLDIRLYEEYNDTVYPTSTYLYPSAVRPLPMGIMNSYYWNNRKYNNTIVPTIILYDRFDNVSGHEYPYTSDSITYQPTIFENECFWTQGSNPFTGSVTVGSACLTECTASGGGVGCGTLAARPATCTPGVGYWATNQSCTDLTGMVGANPATPISGTLYKCIAPNTWAAFYTPYTYPHPLRGTNKGATIINTVGGLNAIDIVGGLNVINQ